MMLTAAAPLKAQWLSEFHDNICREYKRNKYWPEPFIWADRQATIAPFGQMVANGWRRQNLMSDYHFNEENPQLNLAGESKLRYILTQMPPSRRTVFVQRGTSPEETATRVNAVYRAALAMLPAGNMPDVVESDLPNDGWPADDIDAVARKFNATRPDPRLRDVQSNGDSGGGGSGNTN
jgi:hypothetical protein